ncbi:nuclear transport factor 2 family protein [Sphingomonas sp. AR_OL41]|uniref:nuclear transport factor 2 family protein n=1 Tax=Sphingomonas sp. AR_OL41 TaxID=3042729 RepID=UPI00248060AA|nr:nuclear transport factor 2 family protein [Sphingomonas sp. AR_OL41]MDH7974341.1 nuclear transport factor 2 family protein [Sphingomonas sp. AR_OL41]
MAHLGFDALAYTRSWAAAWNAGDIEAVLVHFDDDVVFTSPLAAKVVADSGGIIRGKDALRRYWSAAVDRTPRPEFHLLSVCAGIDSLVIGFRNERGEERAEVLRFRDGLVIEGHGTYAVIAAADAR